MSSKKHHSHDHHELEREKRHTDWRNDAGFKGLKELEGKKLASIVGMIRTPLGKSYGKMFDLQSAE